MSFPSWIKCKLLSKEFMMLCSWLLKCPLLSQSISNPCAHPLELLATRLTLPPFVHAALFSQILLYPLPRGLLNHHSSSRTPLKDSSFVKLFLTSPSGPAHCLLRPYDGTPGTCLILFMYISPPLDYELLETAECIFFLSYHNIYNRVALDEWLLKELTRKWHLTWNTLHAQARRSIREVSFLVKKVSKMF